MNKKNVKTKNAPEPIGPYSQAVQAGNLVFTSGQIALDPASGNLAAEDVVGQTHQVIKNLQAVLEEAGASLESVVKTTIFLKSMNDFAQVNEVYAGYFGTSMPARSTVEVARLPKDVLVEIDCIAIV